MGIGDWVRGIFGSGACIPCDQCRCDIPLTHFEKGIAVIIARKHYCRGCVAEVTRRSTGMALDLGSSSTVLLK